MIRALEFAAFVGLAAALHAGALGLAGARIGSPQAAGADGPDAATVVAASPGLAETVARWQRAPSAQAVPDRSAPASGGSPRPDPPRAAPPPPAGARTATPAAPPVPDRVDRMPATLPQAAPAARVAAAPPPEPVTAPREPPSGPAARTPVPDDMMAERSSPGSQVAPRADALPARTPAPPPPEVRRQGPPDRSPRPETRPESRADPRPDPPSAPARRAAGQGGGPLAGSKGQETRPALSPEERQDRMAGWGGRIRAAVERGKRYPDGARGAGTATVVLRIGADGRLLATGLSASAGVDALDRAAVAAVRAAGPFPPAPDGLGPGPFEFRLRIAFTR